MSSPESSASTTTSISLFCSSSTTAACSSFGTACSSNSCNLLLYQSLCKTVKPKTVIALVVWFVSVSQRICMRSLRLQAFTKEPHNMERVIRKMSNTSCTTGP